jgi:hypothetical protein
MGVLAYEGDFEVLLPMGDGAGSTALFRIDQPQI